MNKRLSLKGNKLFTFLPSYLFTLKKTFTLLLFYLFTLSPLHADEGMWTIYNLPNQVFETMQNYGFELTYDQLYKGDTSLKAAVVNFSGYCSGVVVSPDGLVFTNHHCGFEAIRSHSTVEHDYMLNGFYAKDFSEELPNKDMFVSFMIDQKDVTDKIIDAGFYNMSDERKEEFIDSLQQVFTNEARKTDETYHVEIDAFFEGNKWYATTYQQFDDIRLVFSVPKSMGKFGGETDNWMWPRQTCDYSVFRIYAKNNKPAAYSKDNTPYHPKRYAQVSLQGYKDGDYAMTIGYPGSTSRYLSSYGIKERRDAINAPRAQVRGVKQDVMTKHMRADEAVRIKYDSKFAQSANYWKNSIGMNKCIDSIGIINQKQEFETRLRAWQDSTGYLKGKLDFDLMKRLYGTRLITRKVYTYFTETFFRTNEFSTRALQLNKMQIQGPENNRKKQYISFKDNSDTWDAALDKEVQATLLKNYREHVPAEYLPKFYATIDKKFGGDYKKYVDYLWKNSQLMKNGKKIYVNQKSYMKDPGVQYGLDLTELIGRYYNDIIKLEDSISTQERYLCDAKVRMEEDMPHYSDANFTMRLSYGQVGGFTIGNQKTNYYTDASSIVAKMKQGDAGVFDYKAEPIMHELLGAKDFGKYQDKTTNKMQLCFLTNNDITGGNSGSPMFNGKGELIGLAFDGNWDSLSSDINFDSRLARCIGVDIRYVLYMMDKWGHADRLLKEINAK
jgi:hypothetical protein